MAGQLSLEPREAFAIEVANREAILALQLYRQRHPRSRAQGTWTYYGSTGCRRIATCVFCRCEIVTCSARWPTTQRFWREAAAHAIPCARAYLVEVLTAEP